MKTHLLHELHSEEFRIWNRKAFKTFFFSKADVFAAAAVATILLFIRIGLQPDRQWQPV